MTIEIKPMTNINKCMYAKCAHSEKKVLTK